MKPISKVLRSIYYAMGSLWASGPKYWFSNLLFMAEWGVSAYDALKRYGIDLDRCSSLEDVVRAFQPTYKWTPDPMWGSFDVVYPPLKLLQEGGDDCDGWAMMHAQAIKYVFSSWGVRIVSYLADPGSKSHHFCAVKDNCGAWWGIDPQPMKGQDPYGLPIMASPCRSLAELTEYVATLHGSRVVWYDVRDHHWGLVERGRYGRGH